MVNVENLELSEKQAQYNILLKEIRGVVYSGNDLKVTLEKISTMMFQSMGLTWLGIYSVKNGKITKEVYLGPLMHRDLVSIRNACGQAIMKECTIIVDDVEQFPKHIPSNDLERSEMAIPAYKKGEIALLLNVGSSQIKYFDKTDQLNLQQLMHLLEEIL